MGWSDIWGKKATKKIASPQYKENVSVEYFYNAPEEIDEEKAMSIPTFEACVNIIANTIAQLDFKLIKHEDKNNIEIKDDHRLYLLNIEPNAEMTASTFKKALIRDYLLYGAGIVKIDRDLNYINELYYLPSNQTSTKVYTYDGYKRYSKLTLQNVYGITEFNDYDLMRVLRDSPNGFTGKGILDENKKLLEVALKELNYSNDILKNSAMPTGALVFPEKLSDEAFARVASSWKELYSGSQNVGRTAILEGGADYKQINLDPNKLQLSDMKKSLVSEICKVFGVPESMINDSANKYNSNEQNNIYFLQYCLSPIISSFEATVNKNLLLESEKGTYEFVIDTTNIIRLTQGELIDVISKEYNNGLISFNEAREKLNKEVADNSDDYYCMSLGTVLYKYNKDEYIIPNTLNKKDGVEGGVIIENGN